MLGSETVHIVLRQTGKGPLPDESVPDVDDQLQEDTDIGRSLLCRECLKTVTYEKERIEIHGSHHHTFANPHGIVYEIGCFRSAVGCVYAGRPTGEFTWFRGYRWRIAYCHSCMAHLGWLFVSQSHHQFNGLVLNRLVDSG